MFPEREIRQRNLFITSVKLYSCSNFSGNFVIVKSFEIDKIYYHVYNIWRIFDVLPNFPFTASEMKRGY